MAAKNTNILKAIINISKNRLFKIREHYKKYNNRINSVGEALECYIKDAFADTFMIKNEKQRLKEYTKYFSYFGNASNPPDLIIKNSDSVEVKKIESYNSDIALNSSYPKAKLYSDSSMITRACRNCEKWSIKDIIYSIGVVKKSDLKVLWLIYGDCYAAEKSIYEKIKNIITSGLEDTSHIELVKTNELGKLKKVDPLGITDLRIRGMWHINNPKKVFDYIYDIDTKKTFQLISIISEKKYKKFPKTDIKEIEKNKNITITNIKIKDPNNPVKLIKSKLITFIVK